MTGRTVRWASWDGARTQELTLRREHDAWTADGRVARVADGVLDIHFVVRLDDRWLARQLLVFRTGNDPDLWLLSDGAGRWREPSGRDRPEFAGCLDVDLVCTPFTNTLPIRRLGLAVGEAAELEVVWADPDEAVVQRDPQRYTRLADRRWRFDSLDSDFTAELEVDEDGLVLDYPGLFRRVD
jgi:hypothetical protein